MAEAAGLRYDWDAAAAALRAADPRLGSVIEAVGGRRLEPKPGASPFAMLLRAIVYQQLSGRAAGTIHGRVLGLFPGGLAEPAAVAAIPDEALRAAGLSRAKTAALRDLAEKTLAGAVPSAAELERMDDEAVIRRCTAVRGVGRWTVEMLLIFHLGRPDVLPVADLGVRKGLRIAHRMRSLPEPEQVARRGRRWAPYRSVASWYLWRAVELAGG